MRKIVIWENKEFDSFSAAARAMGVSDVSIASAVKRGRCEEGYYYVKGRYFDYYTEHDGNIVFPDDEEDPMLKTYLDRYERFVENNPHACPTNCRMYYMLTKMGLNRRRLSLACGNSKDYLMHVMAMPKPMPKAAQDFIKYLNKLERIEPGSAVRYVEKMEAKQRASR